MEEFSGLGFASLSNSGVTSELSFNTDKIVAFDEPSEEGARDEENLSFNPLVSYIEGKFSRAKTQRIPDERRWLSCFANYRGNYNSDVRFSDTEQSQVFIKITKTKVVAAYAQIMDILFANNKFPIGVEASPVPQGILKDVSFDPESAEQKAKQMGGAPKTSPTMARASILKELGGLKDRLDPVKDMLKPEAGTTPTSFTYEPAKEAAKAMEELIHDQLLECNASKAVQSFVFDMALLGNGVFKGPFILDKEYPRWTPEGDYEPIINKTADVSYVSLWDAYPDPDARNMDEAEYFIQRHRMNRSQLRTLKKRPNFRVESIEAAIKAGPNYKREYWEDQLEDSTVEGPTERFEVLEFWGVLDEDIAEQIDIEIPKEFKDQDEVQVNAWMCNGQIIRLVLNPFKPTRIPFYSCPYELNPYSFFGIGIAENMEDSQLLMNGFMRLAVDNAALSSNIIFEVDETNLVPGQDMKLYPGKIFRRQGGAPGQSIFGTKFPNVTQECNMMFDKARQLADEATGMPSYSHGISGVMGVGRTASGMSMLMGAAKENIKAVVRNVDEYLLVPLGKAMFAFNMQFNFDAKFIGDVSVVARGTESLMRNEVRSQKLLQFLQIASNPMDAPFVKRDYILRELAASLDLEPDKVVNDPREAGIQAAVILKMQQAMGVQPQAMFGGGGQGGNPAGAASPSDPTGTGGGNIQPGAAPGPGAAGFTGGGGGANSPPQAGQGSMNG